MESVNDPECSRSGTLNPRSIPHILPTLKVVQNIRWSFDQLSGGPPMWFWYVLVIVNPD